MRNLRKQFISLPLVGALCGGLAMNAAATDRALLEVLLANGVITQTQFDQLAAKEEVSAAEVLSNISTPQATVPVEDLEAVALTENVQRAIDEAVASAISTESSIVASHGSKGFGFKSRDGDWSTNLQWRAQVRYSSPFGSDPRQLSSFDGSDTSSFEARRLRMKIGGNGFQPWIKYYFEVDLQPARDVDDSSTKANARVIDYRIDLAKWDWGGIRVGQWKVDLNRERVDSSGRQQFVERSIVNRVFTVDRQVGVQLRGHLFKDSPADMRYYVGVFNGEGRGVKNNSSDHLYMGRLQWNFLGRDLAWRQTDVEYTDKPTGSFAIAGFTNTGPCTRWSSSGCGNLDGFAKADVAAEDQFKIEQAVQELAFKYRGFSFQQEWHRKFITDRVLDTKSDLTGFYVQSGYFFNNLIPSFPAPLELAARYAYVSEPNKSMRSVYNEREEFTVGANWFFAGHNNKITVDFSHLTVDDGLLGQNQSDNRFRVQWDVSF